MSEQTPLLVSVAILKVNWDHGHDYIENFVPFVAECIRLSSSPVISLEELQQCMKQSFGLEVPQFALKTILKRVSKRGFIRRHHNLYHRIDSAFDNWDFSQKKKRVLAEYEVLIGELMEFSQTKYGVYLTKNEAAEILDRYIRRHSLEIISEFDKAGKENVKENFILSDFVFYLREENPKYFKFLEDIIKGRMLADVLFFEDLGKIEQRLSNVKVYFDTTFLLRACGYSYDYYTKPCVELLELLYELGARFACFEHTYHEMEDILRGDAERLRYPYLPAYGETYQYFYEKGIKPSDVELFIARLPKTLENLCIKIKKKPAHQMSLGLNEEKLERILQDEVGYRNRKALLRDIDSLTAIYRLREGRTTLPFERYRAIFVTTNTALARASLIFFNEEIGVSKTPICLPAYIMATLAWLKKPQKAPDLPQSVVIADCYAALSPSDALWMKYLEEVENLKEKMGFLKRTTTFCDFLGTPVML